MLGTYIRDQEDKYRRRSEKEAKELAFRQAEFEMPEGHPEAVEIYIGGSERSQNS